MVLVYAWFRQVCVLLKKIMFEFPAYLLCVLFIFIADAKLITVVLFRSRNLSMPNYRDEEEGVLNV